MEHATEYAIITTNMLVVLASLIVAAVTFEDVIKDQNKTIREAIKGLIAVNNPIPKVRKGKAEQTELAIVPEDDGKAAS